MFITFSASATVKVAFGGIEETLTEGWLLLHLAYGQVAHAAYHFGTPGHQRK